MTNEIKPALSAEETAKADAKKKEVTDRRRGITISKALYGGIFTMCIGVGGAGFAMWRNDSVQDTKIEYAQDDIKANDAAIHELRTEMAANKRHLESFSTEAIDRLKILAEQDRFRQRK